MSGAMKEAHSLNTFQTATAELGDKDGQQYENEAQNTAAKQQTSSQKEEPDGSLVQILKDIEKGTQGSPNTTGKKTEVSTNAPQSVQNDVPQLIFVVLVAILLIVTLVYVIVKALRSRKGRVGLGLTLVMAIVAGGFWFLNHQAQEEEDRISKVWSTAFRDPSITNFESCVERKAGWSSSEHLRKKMVIECGEIAKAIKQGLGVR